MQLVREPQPSAMSRAQERPRSVTAKLMARAPLPLVPVMRPATTLLPTAKARRALVSMAGWPLATRYPSEPPAHSGRGPDSVEPART